MRRRPFYVTLVAILALYWSIKDILLLILASTVAGTHGVMGEFVGLSIIPLLITTVNCGICLVCGIGIFRGADWARLLWAVWTVMDTAVNFVRYGEKGETTTVLIMLIVSVVFLFLPGANKYFVPDEGA